MISDTTALIILGLVVVLVVFAIHNILNGKRRLIHKLYISLTFCFILWLCALLCMKITDENDISLLQFWDACTNMAAAFAASFVLLIALTFTKSLLKLPKHYYWAYVPAIVTSLVVFTNPMHHLHYVKFSIIASEIEFGPYFYVSAVLSYTFFITSIVIIMRYGLKSNQRIYLNQALVFTLGVVIPLIINVIATLKIVNLSIAATPLGFMGTLVCHGIAIYYLDFLNIRPIATQRILDSISDRYIVLSEDGLIITYNKPFAEVFKPLFGMEPNRYLRDYISATDEKNRSMIYNLLNSAQSCGKQQSVISYEQSLLIDGKTLYFIVEITPLMVDNNAIGGYVAIYKDITQLRESMRREQINLSRTMERERLATLGQMIGGISHNLKTPIMSVSGSVDILEKLTAEYAQSIGDPEVTREDHLEICHEMNGWLKKIEDCCSYMSDIITTVKGLATNLNTSDDCEFSVDETVKRVLLLMKHELMHGSCSLVVQNDLPDGFTMHGDINNLVQVVNNLISNAIDAMKDGGDIVLTAKLNGDNVIISVADRGSGIPDEVRDKLFQEMVTSKGAKGTGLGLYISNELIRGRFGGRISYEPNKFGGTTFHITLPRDPTFR